MFIKTKIFFLVLFLSLNFVDFSCSSPNDVPANKVKNPDNADYGQTYFEFSQGILDFGFISPTETSTKEIFIKNITDKNRIINGIFFKRSSVLFDADSTVFPITLAPLGNDNSDTVISVTFHAYTLGEEVFDTLGIKGYDRPTLLVHAIVPSLVISKSQNYGEGHINNTIGKSIWFNNYSNNIAIIKGYYIEPGGNFYIDSSTTVFPIIVTMKNKEKIQVYFKPTEEKEYHSTIKFDIDAQGPIDSLCEVSGVGIK